MGTELVDHEFVSPVKQSRKKQMTKPAQFLIAFHLLDDGAENHWSAAGRFYGDRQTGVNLETASERSNEGVPVGELRGIGEHRPHLIWCRSNPYFCIDGTHDLSDLWGRN